MDRNSSNNGGPVGSPNIAVVITDTLTDKVVALIVTKTSDLAVFTSFDITKEIRTDNPTMNVPHEDVKEMILDEFNRDFCDDYARKCIELTVGSRAFVYYPEDMSAYDHPLAVQPASAPVAPTPTSTAVDIDTDLTTHKRLNIPKPILAKLGLTAGKMVRIDTNNDVMSITEVTASPYDTLQVNTDGRLRLNSRMLTAAFGRLPDKYDIAVSSDDTTIEVTPK